MKTKYLSLLLLAFFIDGCNKNDDFVSSENELQNEPPLSFKLVDVPDGASEVDVIPTLSWESAKNPEGKEVTYDLYLGKEASPTVVYQSDISATSFQIAEPLNLVQDYYWKVVATDFDGATSQSAIHKFTTRELSIPDIPLVQDSGFAPRSRHSTIVFDNRLWVIAGSSGAGENLRNDVWYSQDGKGWTAATAEAEFPKRNIHTPIVFDDKLWIIGGYDGNYANDIWSSSDGINWSQAVAEAPFSARYRHTAIVFDNKLWVIGGQSETGSNNDIWSSENGIDWIQTTADAAFPKMSSHGMVVFKDKLVLFGGVLESFVSYANKTWESEDGVNWTKITNSYPLPTISGQHLLVFDDKLWLLGDGRTRSEIWYSTDAKKWIKASDQEPLLERRDFSTSVFKGKIWLVAGQENTINKSDIWALD